MIKLVNNSIFIPGNTPSSKNSNQWTGKFLIKSKTVRNYLKENEKYFLENKESFLQMTKNKNFPLHIKFKFIRDSKRLFDLINAAQIIQDMMVKHQWIPDDNYLYLIPHFDPEVIIDKSRAGVFITVL